MTTYCIGGPFGSVIEVEIEFPPPCLYCGTPVTLPSMDGPLVCALCDCGCNRDGSKWTEEQYKARHAHCKAMIAKYREAAEKKETRS